ncbi:phage tail tip fiber protein [Orenia marismortui]|uniref:Tip attachment protein J central straight fiber domain-containing protein n=1 Tax=Orenia marismortui TaxID=46469 RepID=A0A4R8GX68_9FIRM|nr:hypothetical protein [Orenia marismortui]TDX46587.1 hypothetical protein C7959_1392 [Orenia marismortui]
MQNIINVSETFKSLCRNEENFSKHEIIIQNLTKQQQVGSTKEEEIDNHIDSLSIDVKEKSDQGNTRTNIVKFDLTIKRSENKDISTIIEQGDIIQIKDNFNSETSIIYTGYVQEIPTKYSNLENTYSITLYDNIQHGIENKFKANETYIAKWICNNNDKANSLAHILAYKMGFDDTQLQLEDVTDINDNYLTVYYTEWKKGDSILSEFTEICKAVNGKLFVNHAGDLLFSNPYNNDDYNDINYTFNILGEPIETPITAKYDKVEVEYSQYKIEDRQVVWQWIEESYDKNNDKANILLQANDNTVWIEFDYVTDIVIDPESTPEILFEDNQGNQVNLDYELEVYNNYGRVKFTNNNAFGVYIQRFKIYGKPLAKFDGNKSRYTEITTPKNPMPTITNKYIQNEQVAGLHSQYAYHLNCKDRTKYEFDSTFVPFLEISNKCSLNQLELVDGVVVRGFKHKIKSKEKKTSIEAINYIPYEFNNSIVDSVKSGTYPDYEVIKRMNDMRNSTIIAYDSKPATPTNVSYTAAYKLIEVECDKVDREDIKGYKFYISDSEGLNESVKFETAPRCKFFAERGKEYTVQVSAIPIREQYESDKTSPIIVKTVESIKKIELEETLSKEITDNTNFITNIDGQEYTVKVDNAGRVTGIGLVNNGEVTEFGVMADRFRVFNNTNDKTGRFIFDTIEGKLYLAGDLIADGTIISKMIQSNAINSDHIESINADIANITAGNGSVVINRDGISIYDSKLLVTSDSNPDNLAPPANLNDVKGFTNAHIIDNSYVTYFPFNDNLTATNGISPSSESNLTLRSLEGRYGGAVAVEENTTNLVANWSDKTIITKHPITNEQIKAIKLPDSARTEVSQYTGLSLSTNANYTISFWVWCEEGESYLYNDLFPDTLPQKNFKITTIPQKIKWVLSSLSSDMSSCRMRFFKTSGNPTIYIYQPQLEQKPYATSFVDGIRKGGYSEYRFQPFKTLNFWAKINQNLSLKNDWCNLIDLRIGDLRVYIEKNNKNELQFGIRDEPKSLNIDVYRLEINNETDYHMYSLVFETDNSIAAYVDGNYLKNLDCTGYSLTNASRLYLGVAHTGGQQINALFDSLIISDKIHTTKEIKNWHEMNKPFYDPNPKIIVPKINSVSMGVF